MFALRVEYLTGVAVSQQYNNRDFPEWPPHPARLYFALASAYFEAQDSAERAFLEWLESLAPPQLYASEARLREAVEYFVPVNDARVPTRRHGSVLSSIGRDPLSVLPECRKRQARTFPAAIPLDPVVYFIWPDTQIPPELVGACTLLCRKVSYLGHSSSLVCVEPYRLTPPPPTLVPVTADQGELTLRVPFPGLLAELERSFHRWQTSRVRTTLPHVSQAYRVASASDQRREALHSLFGHMVMFRRQAGSVIPLTAMHHAVGALRGAVLSFSQQPIPEVLSGHAPSGRPSERPHVAFIPLPDVGHRRANGHLVGLAAVLPRTLTPDERTAVLRALAPVEQLKMGIAGEWTVSRVIPGVRSPRALMEQAWRGPARRWASATPVLLDRHPDRLFSTETQDIVATACERIGLPRPAHILLSPYSILNGVPPTFEFAPARGPSEHRPVVHAVLEFDEPVEGPILIGAGRYRGWGLFKPLPWESPS